jgi:hypothetical protein
MYPLLELTMLLKGWREGVSARGTDGTNSERFHLRAGPSARSDENLLAVEGATAGNGSQVLRPRVPNCDCPAGPVPGPSQGNTNLAPTFSGVARDREILRRPDQPGADGVRRSIRDSGCIACQTVR